LRRLGASDLLPQVQILVYAATHEGQPFVADADEAGVETAVCKSPPIDTCLERLKAVILRAGVQTHGYSPKNAKDNYPACDGPALIEVKH